MSELNKQALLWVGYAVTLPLEETRTDDSLSEPERIARQAITAYLEAVAYADRMARTSQGENGE